MHGENLFVDDSGDWEAVETIGESFPELDVVPALAFIVEAVNAVDRGAFMVASEDEEVFGVLDLVCKQEADGLERLLATVDVVTKEEVVGFRREPAVLEEAQQIVVLPVDIAADLAKVSTNAWTLRQRITYLDGGLELEEDGLGDKNLTGLGAKVPNLGLEKLNLLTGAAASNLEKPVDYGIEVHLVLICHRMVVSSLTMAQRMN